MGKTFCDLFALNCSCEGRGSYEVEGNKRHLQELECDGTKTEMKCFRPKRKINLPDCYGMPAEICEFSVVVGGEMF